MYESSCSSVLVHSGPELLRDLKMLNVTFCEIVQHAVVILQFITECKFEHSPDRPVTNAFHPSVSQCRSIENPYLQAVSCQKNVSNEFHSEFTQMVGIMKKSIDPQISKQIVSLAQQPSYSYVSYFKYDIEFAARFVLNRIEKAHDEINYDHFFNKISDCSICERANQTTSRRCLRDGNFKKSFVSKSLKLFNVYPLEIERKRFDAIDRYKKKNDPRIFTDLYSSFMNMFENTKLIELQMQNLITDRMKDCCYKKSRSELNSKSSKL